MRVLAAVLALLALLSGACMPNANTASQPSTSTPPRLVLQTFTPRDQNAPRASVLTAVDPDTLEDAADVAPLDLAPCSGGLRVQPGGGFLLASIAGATDRGACADAPTATVRLLDLNAWRWKDDIALAGDGSTLRLDTLESPSVAWSPDGRWLYVLTRNEVEQRRLWLIDTRLGTLATSARLNFVPERLDVAPNGSAVFVLGGHSADDTRATAATPGSGFLSIYDPLSLAERLRVPLSGLDIGQADQAPGSVWPGVAMAPDGSRYYVAHADRPLVDVVDVRAPHFERLERSISLRLTPPTTGTSSAWLAASPDGAHLYVWQPAGDPRDHLGLQMIDVASWRVQTVDPIAVRLGSSLNGRWLFRLDPPLSQRVGAQRARDPTGARLSVLDAATFAEQAVLDQDQFAFNVAQYGPERVYVMDRAPGRAATLTTYLAGSWQPIARRELNAPGWLVTAQSAW